MKKVDAMDSHPSDETLHSYLRKHFERMAKKRARQLAEQAGLPGEDVVEVISTGTQPVNKVD
jgi:hypothetical protein